MALAEKSYSHELNKPFGVVVKIGGKAMMKEFNSELEADEFIKKAEQLREKAPDLEIQKIRRKKRGYEGRAESPAFEPYINPKTNRPVLDSQGRVIYKCKKVPPKRGYLFCTECHEYTKFKEMEIGYGIVTKRCPQCGISINDYYVRVANGLEG